MLSLLRARQLPDGLARLRRLRTFCAGGNSFATFPEVLLGMPHIVSLDLVGSLGAADVPPALTTMPLQASVFSSSVSFVTLHHLVGMVLCVPRLLVCECSPSSTASRSLLGVIVLLYISKKR